MGSDSFYISEFFHRCIVIAAASFFVLATAWPVSAQHGKAGLRSKRSAKVSVRNAKVPRSGPAAKRGEADGEIEITTGRPVNGVSMDQNLQMLSQSGPPLKEKYEVESIERNPPEIKEKKALPGAIETPYIQQEQPANVLSPAPSTSFDGLDFAGFGAGWPPDTVGDVGPGHYIQAVNTSVGIFNKTGPLLSGFTFNTMWAGAGTGTVCDTNHRGDPTVVYDPQFDRWVVADFAFAGTGATGPYYECIAVSKTSNPVSGGWWLYAVRTDDAAHPWFADYPKMGIWHDALYMTANMFLGNTFQEARVWAFRLSDLVNGGPVANVVIDTNSSARFSLLPATYHGMMPPIGRDEIVVGESQTLFAYEVFKFHPDFTGAGTTFTGPTNVSQTAYTLGATTTPSSANSLDSIRDALMMQAQYRNIAGVESLWVSHTVRTGANPAPNGIQWAEINVTGGTIASPPVQQQIYGNLSADGLYRWMGSIGVDRQGNMVFGYSTSKNATNPNIAYNGRLVGDPLNTVPQGEIVIQAGGGSQNGNCGSGTCIRWGDYSAMGVDPIDDCTFWYTTEYYSATGLSWKTRIAAFRFPGCSAVTAATVSVSGRIVGTNGVGISNVFVTLIDQTGINRTARSNSLGYYQLDAVPVGQTYIVRANSRKYRFENNPRALSIIDMVVGADFVAIE